MATMNTLESPALSGVVDHDDRRRQFVTETAAPWAKHLRPGDRIETAGPGREAVAAVVEDVCVHSGGYAGLDGCREHPNRDYRVEDARSFEVLAAAFVALQIEPEEIRSCGPGEMTVVVYTIERGA
jgi:hypothetical protein